MKASERFKNTFTLIGAISNAIDSASEFSTAQVVYHDKNENRFYTSDRCDWANYQVGNPNFIFLGKVECNGTWLPKTSS